MSEHNMCLVWMCGGVENDLISTNDLVIHRADNRLEGGRSPYLITGTIVLVCQPTAGVLLHGFHLCPELSGYLSS